VLAGLAADEPFFYQLSQGVYGKDHVDVAVGVRVIVVMMRNHKVRGPRVGPYYAVGQVAKLIGDIKGLLIFAMAARCGNDCDVRARQLPVERRKGHALS
jgi:hypothetical protein